jgi:hypothetical protein
MGRCRPGSFRPIGVDCGHGIAFSTNCDDLDRSSALQWLSSAQLGLAAILVIAAGPISKKSAFREPVRVSELRPMTSAKIARLVPGNEIDESPYPSDVGPLFIGRDGTATRYTGWGNATGRFKIITNRIVITYHDYRHHKDLFSQTVDFFEDREGKPYYRFYQGQPRPVALPLRLKRR